MKTDRQRDAEMDMLLGGVLRAAAPARSGDCPEAGDLAAFVEGKLQGAEHERLELHFSTCDACQQALGAIGRMLPAEDMRPVRAHRSWGLAGWGRFLIPAGAAAALLLVYFGVKPMLEPASPDIQMARSVAPANIEAPADRPSGTGVAPATPPAELSSPRSLQSAQEAVGGSGTVRDSRRPEGVPTLSRTPDPGTDREARGGGAEKAADAAARKEVARDQLVVLPPGTKPQTPAPPTPSALVPVAAAPAQAPPGVVAGAPPPATAPLQTPDNLRPAAPPPVAALGAAGAARQPTFRAGVAESVVVTAATPIAETVTPPSIVISAPGGRVQWRFASGAAIWRSNDAGSSWQLQRPGATGDLLAGSSTDAVTCWGVGRAGLVLLTTDGEHWEARPFTEKVELVGINARDARTATVTARDGRRFTTLDGGATWQPSRD